MTFPTWHAAMSHADKLNRIPFTDPNWRARVRRTDDGLAWVVFWATAETLAARDAIPVHKPGKCCVPFCQRCEPQNF